MRRGGEVRRGDRERAVRQGEVSQEGRQGESVCVWGLFIAPTVGNCDLSQTRGPEPQRAGREKERDRDALFC